MSEATYTPGPWEWRDVAGAGLQIYGTLPAGFKFDGTARGADGKTEFMLWSVRQTHWVAIADDRWVQFSTGPWEEMQRANANLIAAAPDLLSIARRWAALDGGSWHIERHAQEKAQLEADTHAAIAKACPHYIHKSPE